MKKIIVIIVVMLKFLNRTLNLESVLTLLLNLDESEIKNTFNEISEKLKNELFEINFKKVILTMLLILVPLAIYCTPIKTGESSVTISDDIPLTTDDNSSSSVTISDDIPYTTDNSSSSVTMD